MGHHHNHHHHEPSSLKGAFLIAIIANGVFVGTQIIFSFLAHSTSLMADAIHNLGDVMGLILAGFANHMQFKKPTETATYGFKKWSILAALMNGLLLVFTSGMIAMDAIDAIFNPRDVQALMVMIVAFIGIIINGASAFLFVSGKHDLNIRAAFLHLLSDAMISVGVLVSAFLLYKTGWRWVDPVVGLIIALIILRGTWSLFKDSFRLVMDRVPRHISISEVQKMFLKEPGVEALHDLHIWALGTRENALSVHLYMPKTPLTDEQRERLIALLLEEHRIHHVTIQVERSLDFCKSECLRSPSSRGA